MFFTVVWEQILNDFCHFIFVLLRIILVNFTGDHEKNAYFMILDKVCYRYQMNLACWLFFLQLSACQLWQWLLGGGQSMLWTDLLVSLCFSIGLMNFTAL